MPAGRYAFFALALSALAALGAMLAAGTGLLDPSIYQPPNPDRFMPGTLSQDTLTLLVGPLALASIAAIALGRRKAWLIWTGCVAYLTYGYGLFIFEGLMIPLFFLYVFIFATSLWALFLFARHVRPAAVRPRIDRRPPRRTTAVFLLAITALFLTLWLSILIPAAEAREAPPGSTIFLFDLAIMLPLLVLTALALVNVSPLGDLLAVPVLVKMATLGISVLLGTFYAPLYGQPLVWAEAATYAFMGIGPLVPAILFFRAIEIAD